METITVNAPAQDDALFGSLRRVCEPDAHPEDVTARPFSAEFNGEPCTVATNGRVMFIVRGAREDVGPHTGRYRDSLKRLLALQPISKGAWHYDVDYAALRDWMSLPGVVCASCGGTGRKRLGWDNKSQWFGALFGLKVDREQVAAALARLKAETVDVFAPESTREPLIIAADNWRIVWMPFPGDISGLDSFPAEPHTAAA